MREMRTSHPDEAQLMFLAFDLLHQDGVDFRQAVPEGNKKPALTEEQKTLIRKRQELARVRERLQDPDLRPGIARELRKHVAILEREIAELAALQR
jgi:hypothetical protein